MPDGTAYVTGNGTGAGQTQTGAVGGTTANNTSTDPTPTVDAGNLTLVKRVRNVTKSSALSSAGSGEPEDVPECCVTYTNSGQSPVTSTVVSGTIPLTTTPLTSVSDYSKRAIRWQITLPTPAARTLPQHQMMTKVSWTQY